MSHIGVDGFPRPQKEDEKISMDIKALLGTPAGKEVLRYLRSITLDAVAGGGISDGELRHLEGQRFIVALIERRINHAEKVESK
jgi:hypothetical protein|tara:strand:- start:724 stop:975 length:252 start_codon:yes stop_codon:yes gene_type:complete